MIKYLSRGHQGIKHNFKLDFIPWYLGQLHHTVDYECHICQYILTSALNIESDVPQSHGFSELRSLRTELYMLEHKDETGRLFGKIRVTFYHFIIYLMTTRLPE